MRPKVVLVASVSMLAGGVGICAMLTLQSDTLECPALTGTLGGLCLLMGVALLDVYQLKPSRNHTAWSLFHKYVLTKLTLVFGSYMKRKLLGSCRDCQKQQTVLLQCILNQNKDTCFARDYGLTTVRTVEEFRIHMPLTRYSHYEKYVETISENGKTNVMFPFSVDFIALTSGTSKGKSKGYPKNLKLRNSHTMPWFILVSYNTSSVPGCGYLDRQYIGQVVSKTTRTRSGIEQGTVSHFLFGKDVPSFSVMPPFPINKEETSLYVNVLFGLLEEDLTRMASVTTTTTLALFKTLELNWEHLCDDVERGRLSNSLQIDQDLRLELNKRLHKNPARAQFLRSEFRKGFLDIVRRIWPQCRCIFAIRSGSFETQARLLKERYIGDIPIATAIHGGTESLYGINMDLLDEHVRYTLLVDVSFFEFIPEEDMDSDTPATLLAHQLQVGQFYEIVVTTLEGLYRYRTEDVIQITGYRGTAPVYKFIRRVGDILSANQEKVPEVLLHESVTAAAKGWNNTSIIDFTSVENIWIESITGDVSGTSFYVVFLELDDGDQVTREERIQVDEELRSRHEVYDAKRASGKLKAVVVELVRPGTFDKVRTLMLEGNQQAFFMQYKLPRIVRGTDVLKLLLVQICSAET